MSISTSQEEFHQLLKESRKNQFMQKAVAKAQNTQWQKRELSRNKLGNWQKWRELGEQIRKETLDNLDYYLNQFSNKVTEQGGKVYFASTAKEARDVIQSIVVEKKAKKIAKAKSMVTEEIGMNELLKDMGIDLLESDLAEFILQTDDWDAPSHIVFPDIHKNRQQIQKLFKSKLGYQGDDSPQNMARFVRGILREHFLHSDIGITGCNFAIANMGAINLVTNEGNADLIQSLPETQIVVMGMERIVPTIEDAEILDNLLCRSAVGQDLTSYITFAGPKRKKENDGPSNYHVVIVDNGRSKILGTKFQPILQCIRCGACLNVCPVYRHIGGHGYGSIYPGPVGAVLSPLLGGYKKYHDLPFASSLCAACTDTCPVKIPLHELLIAHRQIITEDEKLSNPFQDIQFKMVAMGSSNPFLFKSALKVAHSGSFILTSKGKNYAENFSTNGFINRGPGIIDGWTKVRDMTRPPKSSSNFRSWYKQHQKNK